MTSIALPQHREDLHVHDAKLFCVDCIADDSERSDALGDVATLALLELKKLAAARVERDWSTCDEVWQTILLPDRLAADARSNLDAVRDAALRLRETLDDYFSLRVLMRYASPRPGILAHTERAIHQRVRATLDDLERGDRARQLGHAH